MNGNCSYVHWKRWLLKLVGGNGLNVGTLSLLQTQFVPATAAFSMEKGLLGNRSSSAFWERGQWQKESADVTEKRGFEGGAEMVSGDIEDALSVLYLSY